MKLSVVSCATGVVVMVGVTIVNFRCRIVMKVDLDALTEKAEKRNQALELTYRFEQYIVAVKHEIESLKGTVDWPGGVLALAYYNPRSEEHQT